MSGLFSAQQYNPFNFKDSRETMHLKRKLFSTLSLLAASLAIGPLFVLSWVIGLIIGKLGGGKSEGIPGRVKSIIIPLWKWKVHFHHWIFSLGLISISAAADIYLLNPHVTWGLLGGLVFHGIYSYSDWYKIIIPRHKNKGSE
ncbi:MAG: hypothetical protein R6U37_03145 [Dehalococcoidia bacterium]